METVERLVGFMVRTLDTHVGISFSANSPDGLSSGQYSENTRRDTAEAIGERSSQSKVC